MAHTLLLADDSITIQRVIEFTFADEDIRVITVGDGRQAIDRIRAERPDVVLADVDMPEHDGYEVAEFVKQSPDLAHIPVVLLTAAFEPADEDRLRASGCNGTLAKPFEPQVVIRKVRELLDAGRPAAAGQGLAAIEPAVSDGAEIWSAAALESLERGAHETPGAIALGFDIVSPDASLRERAAASGAGEATASASDPLSSAESIESYFDRVDAALSDRLAEPADLPGPAHVDEAHDGESLSAVDFASAPSTDDRPLADDAWLDGQKSPVNAIEPTPSEVASAQHAMADAPDVMARAEIEHASDDWWTTKPIPASWGGESAAASTPEPWTSSALEAFDKSTTPLERASLHGAEAPAAALEGAPDDRASALARDAGPAAGPGDPAAPVSSTLGLGEAFAALLATEQGRTVPAASLPQPAFAAVPPVTDELVDRVTKLVLERMSAPALEGAVRNVVLEVAERLVREEIARIKSAHGLS